MKLKRKSILLAILLCAASGAEALAASAPTSQFGFSGWPYRQSTSCTSTGSAQGCSTSHALCTSNYCVTVNCSSPKACQDSTCPSSKACGQTQSATAAPKPTTVPTPAPTEVVAPLPTPTPEPSKCPPKATATPKPTATPAPEATAQPTQAPTQKPTATPAPTATTQPTATPTPTPAITQKPQPTATTSPSTGGDYTTPSVTAQEQIAYQLLNQDRQNNGRSALTLDPALCSLARLKSQDMNDNNYFAHTSPTLGSAAQMLKTYGYSFTSVGENIAHHATVEKSQAAFMSSTGHRTNILGTQWTKVGIGVCYDRQGFVYVTQLFVR